MHALDVGVNRTQDPGKTPAEAARYVLDGINADESCSFSSNNCWNGMSEDAQWNAERNGDSQEHVDYDEHEAADNEHGACHDGQQMDTTPRQTTNRLTLKYTQTSHHHLLSMNTRTQGTTGKGELDNGSQFQLGQTVLGALQTRR